MTWQSEGGIRATYSDLVGPGSDRDELTIVRALDSGYNLHRPPPGIRSMPALRPRRDVWEKINVLGESAVVRRPWGLHTKLYASLSVVTAIVLLTAATVTTAGTGRKGLAYLGAMTDSLPPHGNPAGEFRRMSTTLRVGKAPAILFVATSVDDASAAERWPLVKALGQFGKFSGLSTGMTRNCFVSRGDYRTRNCADPAHGTGLPTFDVSHANYRSSYITFREEDLIGNDLKLHPLSSSRVLALVKRYVVSHVMTNWSDDVWHTTLDYAEGPRRFPLLIIGNELATAANVAIPGDLAPVAGVGPATFAQVHESLQSGVPNQSRTSGPNPALVADYNAEANILTAMVCRADGMQPAAVCGRSVVRAVLRHIH